MIKVLKDAESVTLSVSAKSPDDGKSITLMTLKIPDHALYKLDYDSERVQAAIWDTLNAVQAVTSAKITSFTYTSKFGTEYISTKITNEPGEPFDGTDIFTEGFSDVSVVPTFDIYGLDAEGNTSKALSIKYAANPLTMAEGVGENVLNKGAAMVEMAPVSMDLIMKGTDEVARGE